MVPDWVLLLCFLVLLILGAYFAGSETAMMKLNPYRLQSFVNQRHGGARRASKLLERKDRLLGVILIGNNLVNFSAVVVANVVFVRWFGTEIGGVVTTVTTTMVFLIFAEIAPKTVAAERPESIAFPSAYLLVPLQAILKYAVLFINFCGAFIVKPFTKNLTSPDSLSEDDLRAIFTTSSNLPQARQVMFQSLLDIEEIRVEEVMVPREQMEAIDFDASEEEIQEIIENSRHTRMPVYEKSRNNVTGILHMRNSYKLLQELNKPSLNWDEHLEEPVFVPSNVSIGRQLRNFNEKKYRFGVAVDEYGDVVGVITIEDIVATIIGNFTDHKTPAEVESDLLFEKESENSIIVSGKMRIHDLNKRANWQLPEEGPRTVSGLVIAQLRGVPAGAASFRFDEFLVQVRKVEAREITEVQITQEQEDDDDRETNSEKQSGTLEESPKANNS